MDLHATNACAEDVPEFARLLDRQDWLRRNFKLLTLAPFAAAVFLALKVLPESIGRLSDVLIGAAVCWAIAVAAYRFHLRSSLGCPRCAEPFGLRAACKGCGLPRHRPYPETVDESLELVDVA